MMKKFNVGIQLYGVRNALAEDFEGTLKKLKEMGYDYVEFAGYYGKTSEELKEILAKYDLKCVSVHQGLDFYKDDVQAGIDYLKGFGVKYSIIPWFQELANTDKWPESVALMKKIGKALKENGMKLGYHNHDFEFKKKDGKYLHDYIFDDVGLDLIFPELDTCWVHYAGIDPVTKIHEFKGLMPVIHLKDFDCKQLGGGPAYDLIDKDGNPMNVPSQADNEFRLLPLGEGRQDMKKILEACEECGVETLIVEQDKPSNGLSEMECAKISRDYLRKLGL